MSFQNTWRLSVLGSILRSLQGEKFERDCCIITPLKSSMKPIAFLKKKKSGYMVHEIRVSCAAPRPRLPIGGLQSLIYSRERKGELHVGGRNAELAPTDLGWMSGQRLPVAHCCPKLSPSAFSHNNIIAYPRTKLQQSKKRKTFPPNPGGFGG